MKMIRYIILSTVMFISYSSWAQLTLHLDSHTLDSLSLGTYTLNGGPTASDPTVDVVVNNTSNFNINGDILYFGYSISRGGLVQGYTSDTSAGSGFYYPQTPIQIPAGGNATVRVVVHVTTPAFVVGSSIVVIWPILVGHPSVVDSARGTINVIDTTTGIVDGALKDAKVYMSGSRLVVKNTENIFGDIRIYDVVGHLVTTQKVSQNTQIPMGHYAAGIYSVEITLSDGKRGVYKVFNEAGR